MSDVSKETIQNKPVEITTDLSSEDLSKRLLELAKELDQPVLLSELPQLISRLRNALQVSSTRISKPVMEGTQASVVADQPKITATDQAQTDKEAPKESLAERVSRVFTYSRISSFQEYDLAAQRDATGTIGFQKVNEDQPHQHIMRVTSALRGVGISDLPYHYDELIKRQNELFLALQHSEKQSTIYCGGTIARDFVRRPNNVYLQITVPDKTLADELFEAIKTKPNNTLDSVMYGIFKSPEGKSFLPSPREFDSNVHRMLVNPFVHPIRKVTSGIIK